jgi:hypothetical protein
VALLQSLNRHHLDMARDASYVAVADAFTAARPACCTDVLRHFQRPFLRVFAGISIAPIVGRDPYLVALYGRVDQQSLANSFGTMVLTHLAVTDWVADSGTSNHTTSDVDNLTSVCPPTSTLIMSLLLLILFKIFYLFIVLLLTIGVPWSLTNLAFL